MVPLQQHHRNDMCLGYDARITSARCVRHHVQTDRLA